MSTKKKNILFNPYIETKVVLNSLAINHAISIEEHILREKLKEIDQLFNEFQEKLAQKEAEKLAKEAKILEQESQIIQDNLTQENVHDETLSEQITAPLTENITMGDTFENTTSSNDNSILTQENIQEQQKEEDLEPIDFDGMRRDAEANFQTKVKKINSLFAFEVFSEYRDFFEDFNFYENYVNVLGELKETEDLFCTEFFKKFFILKKNYIPSFNSFNIQYIMYMEDFLFSWFLQEVFQKKFRKFKKIKFRKWKFKKRKLRKLYSLKKIRKFIRFKRFKRKNYFVLNKILIGSSKFFKIPKNILVQKIPLTHKVLNTYNVEFFYKLNKNTKKINLEDSNNFTWWTNEDCKFTIYSRNYHQKPYWKLRTSRIIHWKLFYKKTIRKQRYKGFLTKFMKKYTKFSYDYTFLVNFFTKFNISWTRTSKFPTLCKTLFFEKTKNIIKFPIFFNNFFKWRFLKKRNYILKKKIGRWSFLNFKRFKFPWLQRKKNTPKNVNHIQPSLHSFFYIGNLDRLTGCLLLNANLKNYTLPVLDTFKSNFLVKLHMYRYKSNSKWI